MSSAFSAVVYLELWKRYSANLTYRWGLVNFCSQAEHARPEYLAKLRTAKKQVFNFDTNVSEPRVPFWKKKFPMYLFSFSVVILFVSVSCKCPFICRPYCQCSNTKIFLLSCCRFCWRWLPYSESSSTGCRQ